METTVVSDTKTLLIQCFNGMTNILSNSADNSDLKAFLNKLKDIGGYEIDFLSHHMWEISSDGMVDDYCGILQLVAHEDVVIQ